MERLFMGPGRGDDADGAPPDDGVAERVELGERSRAVERPDNDVVPTAGDVVAAAGESSDHWLAALVRADVLALTGVGVVASSVVGLPFLDIMDSLAVFMGPLELSSAWQFAPSLIAGCVALLLGLAALRQAGRHDPAGWVRAVAGAATLLGLLLAAGSAVTWLYAVDSGMFEQGPQF